jgi:ESCRT-II complex subunit VPS25
MARFAFPGIHNFPPFWTRQEVMDTQRQQCDMWCDLIFRYTKARNQSELEVRAALETELFRNDAIGRRLSEADAIFFLERLVERRNAEWIGPDHQKVKMIWRKPEQWAEIFSRWAIENSMTATMFTFYELREGDDTTGEPFHLMDINIMRQALEFLAKQGKAKIIKASNPENLDEWGVKFIN